MRSELHAEPPRDASEHTYACFAWDPDLPFKEIHRAVRSLCWLCVESLADNVSERRQGAYGK